MTIEEIKEHLIQLEDIAIKLHYREEKLTNKEKLELTKKADEINKKISPYFDIIEYKLRNGKKIIW